MKAVLSALSVGLALMVMGTSASAVPFSYRFESSVVAGTFGFPATPGDPASITVTLDNGGTSDLSQVWTAADLESVTFDINNGAATASFFSPFDGGLVVSDGSFATDALGNLISAPSTWFDEFVTADFTANFPFVLDLNWFINGFNSVLFDDENIGPTVQLSLADVGGDNRPRQLVAGDRPAAAADAVAIARRAGRRGPAAPRRLWLRHETASPITAVPSAVIR